MLLLSFSEGKQILLFPVFLETMFFSFTIFVTALIDILPELCCPKMSAALSLELNKAGGLTCFT